jgi:hypothetical protein
VILKRRRHYLFSLQNAHGHFSLSSSSSKPLATCVRGTQFRNHCLRSLIPEIRRVRLPLHSSVAVPPPPLPPTIRRTQDILRRPVFWDMAPCSLFDKYQGFGGTCSIHLHSGRPENACNRFLRNISASPTYYCLTTTPHVAVECCSRYLVQISAQKTTVPAEVPVGFLTPFKNIMGTYVTLRHDRYVHVLSSFTSYSMKATDDVAK